MIFFDRSIPRSVPEALRLVRDDIRWLDGLWPNQLNLKDTVWLEHCGRNDWLAVTRDKRVRTRPAERAMLRDANVGAFILTSPSNLSRWEQLRLFAKHLDEMERLFLDTPRPFVYAVSEGAMRLMT